jgi:hypothetical protein
LCIGRVSSEKDNAEMRTEMAEMRAELAGVAAEMAADMAQMKADLADEKHDVLLNEMKEVKRGLDVLDRRIQVCMCVAHTHTHIHTHTLTHTHTHTYTHTQHRIQPAHAAGANGQAGAGLWDDVEKTFPAPEAIGSPVLGKEAREGNASNMDKNERLLYSLVKRASQISEPAC